MIIIIALLIGIVAAAIIGGVVMEKKTRRDCKIGIMTYITQMQVINARQVALNQEKGEVESQLLNLLK